MIAGMSPGGHLVTTAAACAVTAAVTGSLALTAGVAAGGFLIDVDHAVDYVLFERQRDLRPGSFLRYYVEGRFRRTVLALHSYELFALLAAVAWWRDLPWLWAYLAGGTLHLALDIAFNGKQTPFSIWAFYSFAYRACHRFEAIALLGLTERRPASPHFWSAFFAGTPPPPAAVPDNGARRPTRTRAIAPPASPVTPAR
jgi:hypothetical protein